MGVRGDQEDMGAVGIVISPIPECPNFKILERWNRWTKGDGEAGCTALSQVVCSFEPSGSPGDQGNLTFE